MMLISSNVLKDIGLGDLFVTVAEEEIFFLNMCATVYRHITILG